MKEKNLINTIYVYLIRVNVNQSIQLCFTANWNVHLIINLNFPRTRSSYTCTNRTFQYSQNVCRMSQISQGISILHQEKNR